MPEVIVTIEDVEHDRATIGFPIDALANAAATQGLIAAVVDGAVVRRTEIAQSVVIAPGVIPNSANVGNKLRFHVTDNVNGRTGYFSVPSPDRSILNIVGKEVDLTAPAAVAALVADIEAHWLSRDGNAVTVSRAELVNVNR